MLGRFALLALAVSSTSAGQQLAANRISPPTTVSVILDGPPAPIAPEVANRDAQGRVTVRAVRLMQPIRLDGQLDEELYSAVPPISGFVQLDPIADAPASERTEIWIAYDREDIYVTVRCWDSQPESRWIVNEMRRDSSNIPKNENVAFWFDTFYDRRNAFLFEVTPIGGFYDAHVTNARSGSTDWNPVWARKTGRFKGGWTVEAAIPFKSLRYKPGAAQVWGFNMRRTIRWKNEETYLERMPRLNGFGASAIFQIQNGGTLVGIEAPSGGKNLEVKPYALSSLTTDRLAKPAIANSGTADFGLDVKYGLTQNLTADFNYNADFAQVEVDTQQINLTRFSLFYPEKREFFIESQGIFDFGGAYTTRNASAGGVTPLLFFSRRIGLNGSKVIPLDAGGRLTGKVGKVTVGMLNIETREDNASNTPSTNFSVVRVKRDVLRRSSIGALFTNRSASSLGAGAAQTFGIDAALGFYDFVNVNAYLAQTDGPGLVGNRRSYRGQLIYAGERYGVEIDRLGIGQGFNPDVGYLQRSGVDRTFGSARYSPHAPRSMPSIRRFTWQATYDYLANTEGRLESRDAVGLFSIDFQNSDNFSAQYERNYELLERPFAIARGVTIPVGGYGFQEGQVSVTLGTPRRVSGTFALARGSFYDGDKTTASYSTGRISLTPRLQVEPSTSINWIALREGSFTGTTVSNRLTFSMTPLLFLSGLVQYNSTSASIGSNLRLRWEYQPGSELFIVYTDEHDTLPRGSTPLKNRALVLKINRLLRF